MFLLKARTGTIFYLVNPEATVGRKGCDLLITNDQSISRLHAKLCIKNKKPVLIDGKSKYGTYINREKVEPDTEIELKESDEIRFGELRSFYKVEKITIITTASSIRTDKKKILTNNINFLGGLLHSNWTAYCTHVTMETIQLTVKVLCALIKGIPIVTLQYWEDYVNNVKNNLAPPNVENYIPECSEVTLGKNVSLDYKPERSTLFNNKVFVFPTKANKMAMIEMIKLAGGDAISWDVDPFTIEDIKNSQNEYIILEMGAALSENIEPPYLEIVNCNAELGKRTVPVQEIALALINCSCEKDCNPNFDRKGTVLALKTQKLATQHPENILAMSTQTQNSSLFDIPKTEEIIIQTDEMEVVENKIPEYVKDETNRKVMEVEASTSMKREIESDGEIVSSTSKKMKFEPTITNNVNGKQLDATASTTESSRQPKFSFKHASNVNTEPPKPDISNPFVKKRKTREEDKVDHPSKKSTFTELDDISLPSTSKLINPFSLIKAKKISSTSRETTIQNGSKSALSSNNRKENIPSSTFINGDVPDGPRLDISVIVPVDSSVLNNFTWLSKSKNDDCKSIFSKSSMLYPTCSSDEVDEEFVRYVESFKNVLVIKEEPMVVRRPTNSFTNYHNPSSNLSNGIKNFKKFKKVQPINIQTTIVPESSYLQIVCNERGVVQVVHEESDDEDNALRPPAQRRFVF